MPICGNRCLNTKKTLRTSHRQHQEGVRAFSLDQRHGRDVDDFNTGYSLDDCVTAEKKSFRVDRAVADCDEIQMYTVHRFSVDYGACCALDFGGCES